MSCCRANAPLVKRLVFDLLCFLAVLLPVVILWFIGKPFKRGFYCDDETIRYPFHESTVSTAVLAVIAVVIPLVFIVCVELGIYRQAQKSLVYRRPPSSWGTHPLLYYIYVYYGTLLFLLAANQLTTDVFKYTIGRLRPHFIDICQPDWTRVNCTHGFYNELDVCTSTNQHLLKEARLSFVSGHSSVAVATGVFLILYLQCRLCVLFAPRIRTVLQVAVACGSMYVCCSRVSDYKHHWSDVLSGALLGAVVSFLFCVKLAGMSSTKRRLYDPENDPESSEPVHLETHVSK